MAQDFVAGFTFETFKDDNLHLYAVIRCLEIISEASRRLPEEIKARHTSIPWREMADAGNVYRHEYDHVAARRVWTTLRNSLPPLKIVVEAELAALEDE